VKFTKAAVDALVLPPGKSEHFEWDDDLPGFGVRLRGKTKRWVGQYRVGAQQRRESFGDPRKVPLDAARKIARDRFAKAELGVDPGAERAKARVPVLTLGTVADRYLAAQRDRLAPRTYQQAKSHLERLWRPLRERPMEGIKRVDVAARLQELVKQHGRTAAARARGHLSTLYTWAMREGLCEANPTIGTNNPGAGLPSRDRVLDDRELRILWNACGEDDFGGIVKLLLLTGCRREEIGLLEWSEIDLDGGMLTIPGKRTKNRRTHELLLPESALAILRSAPRGEGRKHVFGRRDTGFKGWSAAKLQLDAKLAMAGTPLAPWTLHDARRTMRSGLGRIGVQPHVAELAINHVRGGIQAIYDRHRYQREIAAALARWAEHILALAEERESNVVALQRA
jgi:integrase